MILGTTGTGNVETLIVTGAETFPPALNVATEKE